MVKRIFKIFLIASIALFLGHRLGWGGENISSRFHRAVVWTWGWGGRQFAKSPLYNKMVEIPVVGKWLTEWGKKHSQLYFKDDDRAVVLSSVHRETLARLLE